VSELSAALSIVPVIGILRRCPPQHVSEVAAAAASEGLLVLEITLDSVRPLEMISELADDHPELLIGAGTVRSVRDVVDAARAGAKFVVSPCFDPEVVAAASAAGIVAVPGAATPTEVSRAIDSGVDFVKLFPAGPLGGPAYVKAILGPLGRPALVPTGGVDASNVAEFMEAGVAAVGVGGGLFPVEALESGDVGEVERRCRRVLQAVR